MVLRLKNRKWLCNSSRSSNKIPVHLSSHAGNKKEHVSRVSHVSVCVWCVCVSNVFTHTRTRLPGRFSSFHTHYMTDLWPHPYIHTLQSARHTASGGSPMHCSYTVNTHRLVLMGYHSNQLNTWRMAVWKHSKQIFTIKVALIRWRLQYITKGLKTDVM